MARLYLDANLPAPAIAQLEKVVRRVPEDPEALILLGERAMAEGRFTEAGMLFQKAAPAVAAFQQNPKRQQDLQMRLNSGGATVDEGSENWAAAADKLQKMLTLDPGNTAASARLGRVLFRLNRGQDAYEQFKKAAADPKMPPPELAMAALFSDKAKAEQWLQNALKQNGKDLRTQVSAGHYRLRNNQVDEAKKHADAALAIDPNSFDANLLTGMIARLGGDYPTAIKHLGAAHLLAPAEPAITNHLALALIELPDETSHQRALQFAELNAKQNPTYIEGLASLGWINYRLNRREQAQRALSAALRANAAAHGNKASADMAYYLAVLSKDAGNLPNAKQLLQDALAANQPFAYRKAAEALLAELKNAPAGSATETSGTTIPPGGTSKSGTP
jgi:tetratricopeptide (TPR) repeat protein